MADLAGLVMEQCRSVSMENVTPLKYSKFAAAQFAESLSGQNVRTVFFLGRGSELAEMLAGAARTALDPHGISARAACRRRGAEDRERI